MTGFMSCEKCSHCMVKDDSGKIIKDYGEKCGEGKDVSDYEASAKEDSKQYGGNFSCNN
jgi:hypothetical protein